MIFIFFQALVCKSCGTLIGAMDEIIRHDNDNSISKTAATCCLCKNKAIIEHIEIPYIFKFLVLQLSAVKINVQMNFEST